MFDCTCNTQYSLLLNQHNGDDAPQEFLFELNIFQINILGRANARIVCSVFSFFFSKILSFMTQCVNSCTPGYAAKDNIMRRMRFACRITKARIQTDRHAHNMQCWWIVASEMVNHKRRNITSVRTASVASIVQTFCYLFSVVESSTSVLFFKPLLTYILTYLFTYLLAYLLTYLFTYLHN